MKYILEKVDLEERVGMRIVIIIGASNRRRLCVIYYIFFNE
jgi:hypothetical protein